MNYELSKDKSLEINYKLTTEQAVAFCNEFAVARPNRRTLKGHCLLHCQRINYAKYSWWTGRNEKNVYAISFNHQMFFFDTVEIAKAVMKAVMMKEDGTMPAYEELGNSN